MSRTLIRQQETTPIPANTTHVGLLQTRQSDCGLIFPRGMIGRVIDTYPNDDERGYLVQFGSGPIVRVPECSNLAGPVQGGKA